MEGAQNLRLSLEEIKLATDNLKDKNFIGHGGFGDVYTGKLTISGQQCDVAVKKLHRTMGQGDREFLTKIQMLSSYRHKNLVSLVGFCDEGGEKILVYEFLKRGSLDNYLSDTQLSWMQRLQISLGMARGLNYIHNDVGLQHRVVQSDIKSSNILLTENWEVKISDFGLSNLSPSNVKFTSVFTGACGTVGYVDPQYAETEILTTESDVYAVGVVLFEILCGRPAYIEQYKDESRFLGLLAQQYYEEKRLREIIYPGLVNEMKANSLDIFTMVAYQCLKKDQSERPNMGWIIEKLEKALEIQACSKVAGVIRFGTWGRQSVGDHWSYELEEGHHLLKITIGYGELIHSLMFTSESGGVVNSSNRIGSWAGIDTVSEVNKSCLNKSIALIMNSSHKNFSIAMTQVSFDGDEEISGISGTVGTRDGYTMISSLSFKTTKRTHGPFGQQTKAMFSVPWDNGSLVGFYGHANNYIEAIGVYLKAHEEIIRVGTWGSQIAGPQNTWSFQLERNHNLKKITIDHGDLIYSLIFTTEYGGLEHDSRKAGGQNGGDKVSVVAFDWDEEIKTIKGTVSLSRGNAVGYAVISSLSFVTNKRTHGPFGRARGSPFRIPLESRSFAGFYGHAASYIDSIGVYLRASI